ncbi:hypothetical protein, partial [Paenibacillus sp. FSL R7-0273]|uniref:hypothetical protein n=1 Tax=Paenibacillus sp. FSL R7-0273 TaxID=1536772 RepID=UPI00097B0F41
PIPFILLLYLVYIFVGEDSNFFRGLWRLAWKVSRGVKITVKVPLLARKVGRGVKITVKVPLLARKVSRGVKITVKVPVLGSTPHFFVYNRLLTEVNFLKLHENIH